MMPLVFVDSALARRLEDASTWRGVNYTHGYLRLHPGAQSAVQPVGSGFAIYVGPGSPANSARSLGLAGEVSRADVAAVGDFFARRVEPARVHACPLADESLFHELRRAGYRPDSFFSVLYFPIPEDFQPAPLPTGIQVARVGPEGGEAWLQVVAEGFAGTAAPTPEDFDILGPNFYAPQATVFQAWIEGQPAGGGGMYHHEGVVELGGASTRVAFRRRGVQRALIEARLQAARAMGCDLAVVLTEPGSDSQRNLQRFGFHLAYTKVVIVREEQS